MVRNCFHPCDRSFKSYLWATLIFHFLDTGATSTAMNHFGSLTRQRTLNRNISVKSRLSSTLTEQYFFADIVYDPEWEIGYDTLEFQSVLGEGAFGRVLKGIAHGLPGRPIPTTVAIKMLKGKVIIF